MHGIDTNSAGNDIVQNIRNALAEEGFNFIQIADYREGVAAPNADGAVTPLESIQQVKENLIGDTELLQMSDIAERRANDKLSIVAELRRELEMAEIAAAEELKIKAKIDEAVEVKKQNEELQASLEELRNQFDAEQVINADLTTKVEDLENTNSALAAGLETANDNLKNEQEYLKDVQDENAELVKEVETLTAELNTVKNDNEDLHRSLKTSDETIASLENDAKDASLQIDDLSRELSEKETEMAAALDEKDSEMTAALDEKDTIIDRLNDRIEGYKEQVSELKDQLKERVDGLKDQLADKVSQLADFKEKYESVMNLVKGKSITALVNFRWEQPTEANKEEDRKELGKIYQTKKKAAPAPTEDKPKADQQK